jgi:hypothetical protein
MSQKYHIQKKCGRLPKKSYSAKGYAEIHKQRPFIDNKNSIWKVLGLKIRTVETCSTAFSIHRNFYFWKLSKSQFLVEFQSFVFGQILADFGNFGQFWAEFAAFTLAESLPEVRLKSLKRSNSWTVSPNVACSNFLESYRPRLPPKKVSKNLKIECVRSGLNRIANGHFGCLRTLRVNFE